LVGTTCCEFPYISAAGILPRTTCSCCAIDSQPFSNETDFQFGLEIVNQTPVSMRP
jgi:hypothetical protein